MMTTYTIKINEKSKAGRAFKSMAESFFKDSTDIEIIRNKPKKDTEIYNPKFVKMILKRAEGIKDPEKRKNWTTVDPNNIWGSIL